MGNCFGKEGKDADLQEEVDFKGGNVHVITSQEGWDQKLSQAKKDGKIDYLLSASRFKVVANFSATWCGPCRVMAPVYTELSEKYPALMFLTIDVDELSEFSSSWDIRATPTFFFMRDGQQVDKLIGANKIELEKKIVTFIETSTR